jgi:hypothetical protein
MSNADAEPRRDRTVDMSGLLRRLGIRGGAILALVLLVALGVVVGRMLGPSSATPNDIGLGNEPVPSSVDPTAGDDAQVSPTPTSFPDDAIVQSRAKQFVAVWVRHDLSPDAWHTAIAKLSTAKLSASLLGVDPTTVPASSAATDAVVALRTDSLAQVSMTLDTGTVTLTLVKQPDGSWLVDAIDWSPK